MQRVLSLAQIALKAISTWGLSPARVTLECGLLGGVLLYADEPGGVPIQYGLWRVYRFDDGTMLVASRLGAAATDYLGVPTQHLLPRKNLLLGEKKGLTNV